MPKKGRIKNEKENHCSPIICLFAFTACDGGGSGSVTPVEPGTGTNTGSGSSSSSINPLTIKILGASSYSQVSGYVEQFYSFEVTNPNSSKAARFTQVTVTLKKRKRADNQERN